MVELDHRNCPQTECLGRPEAPFARDDLWSMPTRMGFTNPNCRIELAICSICSGEWMRGFVGLGESRAMGQRLISISMFFIDRIRCEGLE